MARTCSSTVRPQWPLQRLWEAAAGRGRWRPPRRRGCRRRCRPCRRKCRRTAAGSLWRRRRPQGSPGPAGADGALSGRWSNCRRQRLRPAAARAGRGGMSAAWARPRQVPRGRTRAKRARAEMSALRAVCSAHWSSTSGRSTSSMLAGTTGCERLAGRQRARGLAALGQSGRGCARARGRGAGLCDRLCAAAGGLRASEGVGMSAAVCRAQSRAGCPSGGATGAGLVCSV